MRLFVPGTEILARVESAQVEREVPATAERRGRLRGGARRTTKVVGSLVGWSVQKQEAGRHGEENNTPQ
eukprot:COSAG02_NODE_524_length_20723_cov_79.399438_7_plen_69_part_00